uniref:Secreted protein n=1 Tax=Parascaris univalens TaxID=6257 RepID=A0A915A240_PARUN
MNLERKSLSDDCSLSSQSTSASFSVSSEWTRESFDNRIASLHSGSSSNVGFDWNDPWEESWGTAEENELTTVSRCSSGRPGDRTPGRRNSPRHFPPYAGRDVVSSATITSTYKRFSSTWSTSWSMQRSETFKRSWLRRPFRSTSYQRKQQSLLEIISRSRKYLACERCHEFCSNSYATPLYQ